LATLPLSRNKRYVTEVTLTRPSRLTKRMRCRHSGGRNQRRQRDCPQAGAI